MPRLRLCRAAFAGPRRGRAARGRSRHSYRPSRKASTRPVERHRRGGRPVVIEFEVETVRGLQRQPSDVLVFSKTLPDTVSRRHVATQ
jgi:hypothetical protein